MIYPKYLIILFVLSLISCDNKIQKESSETKELRNYISSINSISELYILTDQVCPACNNKFSHKLQEKINNPKCYIIISANPGIADTKSFENASNVLYDYDKRYLNYGFADSTAYYKIEKGAIKSVIYITPQTLGATLN